MMKAYLSGGQFDGHAIYAAIVDKVPFGENAWEHVAIAEAKRILGETEPWAGGTGHASRRYVYDRRAVKALCLTLAHALESGLLDEATYFG